MNNEKPSSSSTEHGEEASPNENKSPLSPDLELANTVLAFYKDPETQRGWMQVSEPLPVNVSLYLQYIANQINQINLAFDTSKRVSQSNKEESSHKANEESISAALFFVRKVLLVKGADHYRVLGLKLNAPLNQIQNNYRNLRRLHRDQKKSGQGQSAVMRISEAYVVLREPRTKQAYNSQMQGSSYCDPDSDFDKEMWPENRHNESRKSPEKSFKIMGSLMLCGLLVTIAGGVWYSQQEDESVSEERVTVIPAIQEASSEAVELIPNNTSVSGKTENIDSVKPVPDESSDDNLMQRIEDFVNTPLILSENLSEQELSEEAQKDEIATADERIKPTFIDRIEQQTKNTDLIEIKQLIARAERQFERSRLTKPVGDNAYDTYLTILEKDPDNPFALSGLQRIAQKYQGMAVYRLQNEKYLDALKMVRRGLDVIPGYSPLLDLEKRINQNMQPVSVELGVADDPELNPNLFSLEDPSNENTAFVAVDNVEAPEPETFVIAPDVNNEVSEPEPVNVSNDLTAAELDHLLTTFVFLYEKGELEPFLELFSEDAKTNNRLSKSGVKKDYQSLFDSTSRRLIRLRDVRWSIGSKDAMGEADFTLTIVKKETVRPRSFEGRLTFQVVKTDRVMITGLYHSQEKVER